MSDIGTTVKVEAGFPIYSKFLDRWFTGETKIRHGETREDAILRLEKELSDAADKLRSQVSPQEYDAPRMSSNAQDEPRFGPPPVIDYGKHDASPEGVLADIEKCQTLDELKSYKLLAASDKTTYSVYCKRLKELSV